MRTGLPFSKANVACGVKNAATRKYLTRDHFWYCPPEEMLVKLAEYANRHGDAKRGPYFSLEQHPVSAEERRNTWHSVRAKFYCEFGITNVWREPPVRGRERVKLGKRVVHMNQKPLRLLELIIRASSDEGDVIWEPFGGLCSVAIAAHRLGRVCYSAELSNEYLQAARARLATETHERNG